MLNSFMGIGRLGQDAEVKTTRNGDSVARFSIAIDRIQRKGTANSEPDWIRCSIFGDRALMLGPYLSKGLMVGVRGRLKSYRTTGENPRQLLEVSVQEVNFLHRPQRDSNRSEPAEENHEVEDLAPESVVEAIEPKKASSNGNGRRRKKAQVKAAA